MLCIIIHKPWQHWSSWSGVLHRSTRNRRNIITGNKILRCSCNFLSFIWYLQICAIFFVESIGWSFWQTSSIAESSEQYFRRRTKRSSKSQRSSSQTSSISSWSNVVYLQQLTCNNSLLSHAQLRIRHITPRDECIHCGRTESVDHLFVYAGAVWDSVKDTFPVKLCDSPAAKMKHWLFEFLNRANDVQRTCTCSDMLAIVGGSQWCQERQGCIVLGLMRIARVRESERGEHQERGEGRRVCVDYNVCLNFLFSITPFK